MCEPLWLARVSKGKMGSLWIYTHSIGVVLKPWNFIPHCLLCTHFLCHCSILFDLVLWGKIIEIERSLAGVDLGIIV